MAFTDKEILETVRMFALETLDIRTTTLGINLLDCADPDLESTCEKVYAKIVHHARDLVPIVNAVGSDYGIPIVNKRIATTPISLIAAASGAEDLVPLARAMDAAAEEVGVDFIGGFTSYVHKGFANVDRALFASIPGAMAETKRVCASLSVASTRSGVNMDAVMRFARVVLATADLTTSGVTRARALAITGLAEAVARGDVVLDASRGLEVTVGALKALPGIGEWTAQYIAMRALREPDALPLGDLGLVRALFGSSARVPPRQMELRTQLFRPFRAYACLRLWLQPA